MTLPDRKIGPFSWRFWGLVINFFANAIAIHGAVRYMLHSGSPAEMYTGIALTVVVCLVVAIPAKNEGNADGGIL